MTDTADKRDFFVSFNQADRAWATWIAWVLEEAKYSVWFQDWDFKGNFVLEMDKAHQQSRRTLAVLSPEYFASRFTAPEWAARFKEDAESKHDLLIPVRVRECEPPGLLGPIVYVDFVGLTRDQACRRLLDCVAGIRLKPNEEPFYPGGPRPAAARSIPSEPRFPIATYRESISNFDQDGLVQDKLIWRIVMPMFHRLARLSSPSFEKLQLSIGDSLTRDLLDE